jgi:hypothetical protein
VIRWIMDRVRDRKGFNDAQKARVENASVLIASGLIAGEALMGLVKAGFNIAEKPIHEFYSFFETPPSFLGPVVLVLLAILMIIWPNRKAGSPDEPAPPTAIM